MSWSCGVSSSMISRSYWPSTRVRHPAEHHAHLGAGDLLRDGRERAAGHALAELVDQGAEQALERGDVGPDPSGAVGDAGPGRAAERAQPGGLGHELFGLRGELGEVGVERVVVVGLGERLAPATPVPPPARRAPSRPPRSSQVVRVHSGGLGVSPSDTAASRPCAGTSADTDDEQDGGITSSTAIQKCHTTARTGLMGRSYGPVAPRPIGALRPGRMGSTRGSPGSTTKPRSWASIAAEECRARRPDSVVWITIRSSASKSKTSRHGLQSSRW